MSITPLAMKLRIQPGQRIMVMNAPPGYLEKLGNLPEDVQLLDEPAEELDLLHLFVRNIAELDELGSSAIKSVKFDGILWISYPKKSSKVKTDISRDVGWEIMAENGLRPVTQISIDETWSALRFRPQEQVGK